MLVILVVVVLKLVVVVKAVVVVLIVLVAVAGPSLVSCLYIVTPNGCINLKRLRETIWALFKQSKAHGLNSMAQVYLGHVHLHFDN